MKLPPGEVHVWVLRLDGDPEPSGREALDRDERDRAARFAVADARRRFERRRAGLRSVLAAYLGVEPSEVAVDRTCARCGHPAHGKPRLAGGGPEFSAAASGDLAVVAVASGVELGIDVEAESAVGSALPKGPPAALLTPAEREALDSGALRPGALWVRKEALAKGAGTGLVAAAGELDIVAPRGGWRLRDLPDVEGCLGALATRGPVRSVLVRDWERG